MVLVPTEDTLAANEYQHVIEKALKALNEIERRVIFLRFWEPNTIAQVADRLGIAWHEADILIDGAVKKIQKEIKKYKTEKAAA
jgi:DNA-directed RNA polymerase specialized sigma24 family protein